MRRADARLDLIARAAANNAALCDAVCRSHGIAGRFDDDAWVSATRAPRWYPDAVTLGPVLDHIDLLDRVDATVGCSVKDSFATLDLSTEPGWSVLFEATWVAHGPARASTDTGAELWDAVTDADGLAEWAAAWGTGGDETGLWRPEVLGQDLVVLAGRREGTVVSGGVVNVAADVVGISNVFSTDASVDVWRSGLAWIGDNLPGRTIVGYESGDDLTVALDHGLEPIGPLRVWICSEH
jgi:hypothetical protein